MKTTELIITCEHGGSNVPQKYHHLFQGESAILASHRGFDLGALPIAKKIAAHFQAPLFYSETTRLLVELNRSLKSRFLFSRYTEMLPQLEKNKIVAQYYLPYRKKVEDAIRDLIKKKRKVLHLSIHSFTPVLDGDKRDADIGLLYDPSKELEKQFCARLGRWLKSTTDFRVRYNYPYRGISDGFTTCLRTCFSPEDYLGIEIELNQRLAVDLKAALALSHKLIQAIGVYDE